MNKPLLNTLSPDDVDVFIRRAGEAEVDEMWSFVQKKKAPRWLWHAIDYHTGKVLAYVFGRRQDTVFLKLKALFLTVAPKMHSSLASRINSASEGIRRPLEPLVAHLCSVVPHQFGSTSGAHDVFLCFQGLSGVDAVYRRDSWLLLRA